MVPRDLSRSFNGAVSPDSSAFIRNTSTHDFAHIKSLDLDLRDLDTKLALDLNNKHDPIKVVKFAFYPFLLYGLDQAYQERKDRLMLELRTIAMGMATRERSLKLQGSDFDRLYKAVRSSLYSQYVFDAEGRHVGSYSSFQGLLRLYRTLCTPGARVTGSRVVLTSSIILRQIQCK